MLEWIQEYPGIKKQLRILFVQLQFLKFLVLHTLLMFLKLQTICNENDAANYGFKIRRRNERLH